MSENNEVPPISPKQIEINPSNLANEEELSNEIRSQKDKEILEDTMKYSNDYKKRASEIDKKICYWGGFLFFIIVLDILYFTRLSNCAFTYSIESINNALKILASGNSLKPNHLLWIYYLTKILPSLFFVGLTYWIAKIYNQLRRLSITYRDKVIIMDIFEKLILKSNDPEIQKLIREYALKEIFALSLEQAEKSTPKRGDINTKFELNK